jgi:hypothetical protein
MGFCGELPKFPQNFHKHLPQSYTIAIYLQSESRTMRRLNLGLIFYNMLQKQAENFRFIKKE